jgi:hypothetical protein
MLKIFFQHTQNNGCGKYRMWQPAAALESQGLCEVRRVPDNNDSLTAAEVDEVFNWADVVVCQPFSELVAACLFVAGRDHYRKKLVVDLDDDIWSIHPHNVGTVNGQLAYIKNVFSGEFDDFWELQDITEDQLDEYRQRIDGSVVEADGKLVFVHQKAPDVRLAAEFILEHADAVTTTNELLAETFRRHTKAPVYSLPNCLNLPEWSSQKKSGSPELWLGWCGSVSHYPDCKPVAEVIDRLMKRYKQLRLQVMGSSFDYFFPIPEGVDKFNIAGYKGDGESLSTSRFEDAVERWPGRMRFDRPVPIQDYTKWMSDNWQSDIGLAPLEDNVFNAAKSSLKWLEYSALGAVTVASKVGPYKRDMRHDKDGKLCGSMGAWQKGLEELIETPEKRQELTEAATQRLHDEFDQQKQAKKWLEVYDGINNS